MKHQRALGTRSEVSVRSTEVELEFRNVGFCGGRNTGEKPSGQGREPTTYSTHM